MKSFLIGAALICLLGPWIVRPVSAQDIDTRCKDVYDKVACKCALQNGGRILSPPVGVKREGLKLLPREGTA